MHDIAQAAQVSQAARTLSHPTRLRILLALLEGEATPTDLSRSLGLTPEVVARHLSTLGRAGMARCEGEGAARVCSADAERVEPALEALRRLGVPGRDASAPSPQAAREVRRNSPMRQARTCHDHMGGSEGVALLEGMVARGWLTPEGPRPVYLLTLEGGRALAERGVELERRGRSRRTFAYGCLDWTERRPHLGGALGAAVRRALQESGYLRHKRGTRVIEVVKPLEEWLEGR